MSITNEKLKQNIKRGHDILLRARKGCYTEKDDYSLNDEICNGTVMYFIKDGRPYDINEYAFEECPHSSFFVIGLNPDCVNKEMAQWNPEAVICYPAAYSVMPASDFMYHIEENAFTLPQHAKTLSLKKNESSESFAAYNYLQNISFQLEDALLIEDQAVSSKVKALQDKFIFSQTESNAVNEFHENKMFFQEWKLLKNEIDLLFPNLDIKNRQEKTLRKNLKVAHEAIQYASQIKYSNTRIEFNKLNEEEKQNIESGIVKVRFGEFHNSPSFQNITPHFIQTLRNIHLALSLKCGNCEEFAKLALYNTVINHPNISASMYEIAGGDHVFFIIGEDPETQVLCDPWSLRAYPAKLYLHLLRNRLEISLENDAYINKLEKINPEKHKLIKIENLNSDFFCNFDTTNLITAYINEFTIIQEKNSYPFCKAKENILIFPKESNNELIVAVNTIEQLSQEITALIETGELTKLNSFQLADKMINYLVKLESAYNEITRLNLHIEQELKPVPPSQIQSSFFYLETDAMPYNSASNVDPNRYLQCYR